MTLGVGRVGAGSETKAQAPDLHIGFRGHSLLQARISPSSPSAGVVVVVASRRGGGSGGGGGGGAGGCVLGGEVDGIRNNFSKPVICSGEGHGAEAGTVNDPDGIMMARGSLSTVSL